MASHRVNRRLTFQQAVRAILEDASNNGDFEEEVFPSEEIVPPSGILDNTLDDTGDGAVEIEDDGELEIFEENDDAFSEEAETTDDENEEVAVSANGISYLRDPPAERRRARNIMNFEQRPRNLAHVSSELEALLLFLPEEQLRVILRHTNRKCRDVSRLKQQDIHPFSYEEFLACLGVLIRLGSDRDNFTSLDDIWSAQNGRPFYRAVISRDRFKTFLSVVRFDNYRTRAHRLPNDRLAAVSEIWEPFIQGLRRLYIPGFALTVDEQLLGYRGRVPGRTYMPAKPRKYGLKIFWLCEAGTGFALNGMIYTGRGANEPVHRNLGEDIVTHLASPYFGSNREIVTDNFFTSHSLAVSLLNHGLTLLGTIRKQRREVPVVLRQKMAQHQSKFLYDHVNKITLVSYAPTRNRIVLLLSSSHGRGTIATQDELQRPDMILDYNIGKGGVDQMDENVEEFSCVRKTVRWPLLVFLNVLNVACNNAYIFMCRDGYTKTKKQFLRQVSLLLSTPFAKERHRRNRGFQRHIVAAAEVFGFVCPAVTPPPVKQQIGRCHLCSSVSRSSCDKCGRFACPKHKTSMKKTVCSTCVS